MPIALVGIISVVLVWDTLRRAGDEWGLERNGYRYRALAFVGNTGTIFCVFFLRSVLVILYISELPIVLLSSVISA